MTKEPKEQSWWDDKTIQIPKGLLIKGVSGEAVAVYAKMKGFGKDVRCSMGALALRLEWSVPKTRKYQKELQDKGWIVLVCEGEASKPRVWFMASNAGELPPREIFPGVSKNSTPRGIVFEGPSKTAPKANKEVLQATPKEQESATALPDTPASITPPKKQLSKKQLEILPALPWVKHFKDSWENKMKDTWPTETGAVKEILRYQSEGVTFDQFKSKVAAYLAMDSDSYVAQERWGLMVLLRWRWTKIAATAKPTLPPHLQKPESAI